MLGEYGETLLMDWGLAKSQKQSLPYSELEAKAHTRVANAWRIPKIPAPARSWEHPHYMSPEQAVGDGESINQRSEVYSVGATLYSVLTGKPPFSGQTREEILDKVRRGDFLAAANHRFTSPGRTECDLLESHGAGTRRSLRRHRRVGHGH